MRVIMTLPLSNGIFLAVTPTLGGGPKASVVIIPLERQLSSCVQTSILIMLATV